MSNQVDPDFNEGHEVTWWEVFVFSCLVGFMLTIVVMFASMIDKLYWLGYVVVGAGVIYFGGRFIKKYIFRK